MPKIKIHHYGNWIGLCVLIMIFYPIICVFFEGSRVSHYTHYFNYFIIFLIFVFSVLGIRQNRLIGEDKDLLISYEDKNNMPYIHSVPTYLLIYPFIIFIFVFIGGYLMNVNEMAAEFCILFGFIVGLIPGPILFVLDQRKLKQYCQKHSDCREKPVARVFRFWGLYIFELLFILGTIATIYDFMNQFDH